MGFEQFQAIIGEVKGEWATPDRSAALNPFLLHVFAADASHLKLHVTDFQCYTWEATRSTMQLEDMILDYLVCVCISVVGFANSVRTVFMVSSANFLRAKGIIGHNLLASRDKGMRDCIGVGGSWSEFMDYFISSLKSEDLKLILDGRSKSNDAESGSLVAQKSRGMPKFSISLTKLMGSDAGQAIANLSLKLFRELKEQERCCKLTQIHMAEQLACLLLRSRFPSCESSKTLNSTSLANERSSPVICQEKSQALKSQLDVFQSSKRQKLDRTTPEIANLSVPVSDTSSVTGAENSPGKQKAGAEGKPSRLSNRVIPAHRRAKVRGAILIDSDED